MHNILLLGEFLVFTFYIVYVGKTLFLFQFKRSKTSINSVNVYLINKDS
jgi:hypothetical protein